ncbi:unnamed protein product [Zymoseptoria tritici ST99CH_3D1]|nr:unnamed protein product [Zymoseptoria tritici ST99CH_3D1]
MSQEEVTRSEDPEVFADLLNLEDQYHNEGYLLGVADGSKSGRIEGRVFGLQKGFEKFVKMGRLNGKAAVWEARLPSESKATTDSSGTQEDVEESSVRVEPLKNGGDRLRKHVLRLAALSDPDDLSTDNDEDSVSEFDDRLKDAKAKATLIARLVGDDEPSSSSASKVEDGEGSHLSGAQRKAALRVKQKDVGSGSKPTGEMEDFVGLRGAKG